MLGDIFATPDRTLLFTYALWFEVKFSTSSLLLP